MNGRDEWGRGRDRDRDGYSDRIEDMGADKQLDRCIRALEEALRWAKYAERTVDDIGRDLMKARELHRRGEAMERREEAIEREALGDVTGTSERRERRDGDRDRDRDRDGRRGDWRGR